MPTKNPTISQIKPDLQITSSRSGGPGGQHANKVETKVTLRFSIRDSNRLTEAQKSVLLEKLKNRINKEGELLISVDSQRSQIRNKEIAFKNLDRLIKKAFEKPRKRKRTKPGKGTVEKRLKNKKKHSEKKKMRQKL